MRPSIRTSRRSKWTGLVFKAALAGLVLALAGTPLWAYTIYLKDGSQLQAKEKYKIEGDRVNITLPNGTPTFLPLSKVDIPRTDQANALDYGTATVLGDQKPGQLAPAPPTKKTISDLIENKAPTPRELPPARREDRGVASPAPTASPGTLRKTKGGFLDLAALQRRPFGQADVIADLQQFCRSQGVPLIEVYQGTTSERPLVEVIANSEPVVFKSLAVVANALLQIRDRHPKIAAVELILTTPSRERAGQFVLTPDMASDLVGRLVEDKEARNGELSQFYLKNVQF